MSHLSKGDEIYHNSEGSHLFEPPDNDTPLDQWRAAVQAHVLRHQEDRDAGFMPKRRVPPMLG